MEIYGTCNMKCLIMSMFDNVSNFLKMFNVRWCLIMSDHVLAITITQKHLLYTCINNEDTVTMLNQSNMHQQLIRIDILTILYTLFYARHV